MNLREIITYFDLFDYPLTKEEISNFAEIKKEEWKDEKIEEKTGFYFLQGRSEIISIRREREKYAKKLWRKTRFYLRFLKIVPFLKMVAICNSLAFNHPEEDSDIDLFIVTAKNRLWIARVWTTFLLQILGVRRHGDKVAGRFCLSFWCTEEAIDLEAIQIQPEDPYLAFWCLTLRPVLDDGVYVDFMRENSGWIEEKYGLKSPLDTCSPKQKKSLFVHPLEKGVGGFVALLEIANPPNPLYQGGFIAGFFEKILKGKVGDWLEKKLKNKLRPRAEAKAKIVGEKASIIVSDQMLKFHNHDKRREVWEKWKEKII